MSLTYSTIAIGGSIAAGRQPEVKYNLDHQSLASGVFGALNAIGILAFACESTASTLSPSIPTNRPQGPFLGSSLTFWLRFFNDSLMDFTTQCIVGDLHNLFVLCVLASFSSIHAPQQGEWSKEKAVYLLHVSLNGRLMLWFCADGGHNVVLEIQATLPSPPRTYKPYMKGVYVAYAMLTWCYFGISIAGYYAFGKLREDSSCTTDYSWSVSMHYTWIVISRLEAGKLGN